MVRALSRRGPDDHGVWQDPAGGIALGHARLSIIDLSAAGHQPMTHGDGRFWITFNGEIYNYRELRNELDTTGAVFATHTDTEVILAGWARWGPEVLPRLRGMFAFALWDRQTRSLVLVRDRLGVKPLLWAEVSGGVVFASEIKGLLASGLVAPVLEPRGLFDLLATGSVCQPGTILRGVQCLEPGTYQTFSRGGGRQIHRYWDAEAGADALRPELARLSYDDCVHLVRERLEEACRYHLIADVPVGSFLSGGIDSTAVTALMSRNMAEKVRSFSVGFANTREVIHELDAARVAADFIGCQHAEVILTGHMVAEAFDDLVLSIDQPSHDGANTYFVSQAARRHVKVALSGLGGDELFAGYPHFATLQAAARRPPGPSDRILRLLHRLRPNRLTRTSDVRCRTMAQRFADLRRALPDAAIAAALAPSLRDYFQPAFLEAAIQPLINETQESLAQTSLVECRQYLLNTLLHDADAMSMGHSLEVRPVLLDHKLVELALALPPETKIQGGRHKAILKDAVRDLLPPSLLTRQKTGFGLPLGTWLGTVLRERMQEELSGETARSYFAPGFLAQCMRNIGNHVDSKVNWTVLVFLSWARVYRLQPSE